MMKSVCRIFCVLMVLMPMVAMAQVPAEKLPMVEEKVFRHGDLQFEEIRQSVGDLTATRAQEARRNLGRLGATEAPARIDARSGRFVTLWPTTPIVPGAGVGNDLQWNDFGLAAAPKSSDALESLAWASFQGYLADHQAELGLDLAELAEHRIASHGGGDVIQIHIPRRFENIEVRGAHLNAVINKGNLILMGMHQWGDRGPADRRPELGMDQILRAVDSYLNPLKITREWAKPFQVYLPVDSKSTRAPGYAYRLAWAINVEVAGDMGRFEVLVDARSAEVLSMQDQNHYAEAKGGVLPVTNDGVVPDGVEQPGWPMPFLTVGGETTDTGGNYVNTGSVTANLSGPYVLMNDNCGSISLTQSGGLDFGQSGGTDCTTPGFGGAGNTHSSRTGFYELNKIIEMARGQLPSNGWLQNQLRSNMNINSTCNAFWNGTVNFYRSGGGCANTGEIAGVFDHEWGHGMDANDVNGGIASPSGEGIADIYTALRLNSSCIGRNFRLGTNCTGNGDPCLSCDGVRDIDYLKRQSGQPHDYSWSNANCGGSVHCVGGVYSEAVWSLWKRKLQSAPYNYDNNTAHEIVTRLTFIGAGATSTWFSGGPPNGGCAASSGYQNYLAADDDNGNLNDGTPHMTAIYESFNDQEIACGTPTVQDSGCANNPTSAPTVSGTPGNQSLSLSWTSVANATEYEVFRTEGVFACDFGKVKVATTTGTSFNDSGLQNGRTYSYVVIPKGASDSCFGPASSCTNVTPVSAPDFVISCNPGSQSIAQAENGTVDCTVTSLGGYTGTQSLSCSGNPAGIGCAFAPSSTSPPANGSDSSTLTLSVGAGQATGSFSFDVVANDGSTSKTSSITVNVTPAGQNGPQTAVYDAGLGAPRCSTVGTECDSVGLLDGRANLGPEPNQPNTLDSCTDGTSGSYHSDESNDRLIVRTLDGYDMAEGATVEVEATVWAWSTGSSDTLDLYYAADANSPSWTLIGSFVPGGGGAQVITAQYTLPAGSLQAVRANFRYQGSQSSCTTGNYDDADDLVFAVGGGGPTNTAPSVTITAPADGSSSTQGDSVSFAGSANDAEDGDLTASIAWSSSLDGSIGTGGSFSTSGLSVGTHTITASVTDSGSLSGSDSISITVNNVPNNAPTVSITAPADGSSFDEGTSVTFSGTANDTEDGNISASLAWSSSIDGSIGSGASFSTSALSAGTHTITASVTDSGGASGSDSISVTINTVGTPVTVTFTSIGAEDGWVRESNETSNVGGSANSTGAGRRPIRPGDTTQDRQFKSILSFDTSSIPAGATIQSATIRLRRGILRGENPFTSGFGQCLVDVNSGGFGGNNALQASDFEAAATAVGAASLSAPAADLDWSEGTLDAAGLAAINDSGRTQVRVYFELDDNDDGNDDLMGYYSGDNGNASYHPQLVVTYID